MSLARKSDGQSEREVGWWVLRMVAPAPSAGELGPASPNKSQTFHSHTPGPNRCRRRRIRCACQTPAPMRHLPSLPRPAPCALGNFAGSCRPKMPLERFDQLAQIELDGMMRFSIVVLITKSISQNQFHVKSIGQPHRRMVGGYGFDRARLISCPGFMRSCHSQYPSRLLRCQADFPPSGRNIVKVLPRI